MLIEKVIRMDLLAMLAIALVIFTAAFASPIWNAMVIIYEEFVSERWLIDPTKAMQSIFLLSIEGVFLAFVAYLGYRVISRDREMKD